MTGQQFDLGVLIAWADRLHDLWQQYADSAPAEVPSWLVAEITQLEASLRHPLRSLIAFVGSLPDDAGIAALITRVMADTAPSPADGVAEDSLDQDVAAATADDYARFAALLRGLGLASPPDRDYEKEESAPPPAEAGELELSLDDEEVLPPPPRPTTPPAPVPAPAVTPPIAQPEPQSPPRRREETATGGSDARGNTAVRGAADVHFSAYYPPQISDADSHHAFIVYAHLAELLGTIETDAHKFASELGGSVPPRTAAPQSARLLPQTPVTITPAGEGLVFDPPSLTKTWDGRWVRFNFDLKPTPPLRTATFTGRVAITVGLIEIAHIDFSLSAAPKAAGDAGEPNPLAQAKLASSSAALYQKIFVSYSRKDREVVDSYRAAQIALGNEVFVDTESIRTGQNWQAALAQAIDSADIFQLFWSPNSAASSNVRDEWDYALRYRCPHNRCAEFLRPVYWHNPLTTPPAALGHLNFRYMPLSQKESVFVRFLKKLGLG